MSSCENGILSFSDDEPLPVGIQNVSISAEPECDAVAASESKDNFRILVRLRAPPLSEIARRAPIDLIMVLEVNDSMQHESKLDHVKRATSFVIDHLGPSDRLSIVSFDSCALKILPLRRMTEQGRGDAKRAVDSLSPGVGGTNIVEGLAKGVQVLEERRHRNPVASIMFLSGGQDNSKNNRPSEYLIASIVKGTDNRQTVPIHGFGFGLDHDSLVMYDIADSSGGTFSFIESYELLQDSFARCIGGLLSVVVREIRLTLRTASDGVNIKTIHSGKHISEVFDLRSRGTIIVGNLYADEEKDLLIDLFVPVYTNKGDDELTSLLDITCSYIDVLSDVRVQMESVEIRRPGVASPCDVKVKLEVDRQKNRLDAVDGLAEAQRVAETGDLEGARAILLKKISEIRASMSGQASDGLMLQLQTEMKETEEKMRAKGTYEREGRAYALSCLSAHANQRATTSGSAGSTNNAYVTPNMDNMVKRSQSSSSRLKM